MLAGVLSASALSLSGLVKPADSAQQVGAAAEIDTPPSAAQSAGEGGPALKAPPLSFDQSLSDDPAGFGAGQKLGAAVLAPENALVTGDVDAVPTGATPPVKDRPFLDDFALEALLIEAPVHCVEDGRGDCRDRVVYEHDALFFYRETILEDGSVLEVSGIYEVRDGAVCHNLKGLTAMVFNETLDPVERRLIEKQALADFSNERAESDAEAACWRLRPAATEGVFEAVSGTHFRLMRAGPLV